MAADYESNIMTLGNNNQRVIPEYDSLSYGFNTALTVVDDIVLKNYITHLHDYSVDPLDHKAVKNNISENVRIIKITEMVYEKDEFSSYKFASVFNTLSSSNCSVFLIADSDGEKTDFYMGIRAVDEELDSSFLSDTLENALTGQFPGIKTENIEDEQIKHLISKDVNSVSIVSCVANSKDQEIRENKSFVQGLEKLAYAMQGKRYTAIILANSTSQSEIDEIRRSYEEIYTQLSPFSKYQVGFSTNFSLNTSRSDTVSDSHGITTSDSHSTTMSDSHGITISDSHSKSVSKSKSKNRKTLGSKLASAAAFTSAAVGVALAPVTGGASILAGGALSSGFSALGGNTKTKSKTKTTTDTHTEGITDTHTEGITDTHNEGLTDTHTEGTTDTTGITDGSGRNITLNAENKSISNIIERLDIQLKRLHEFESLGMWECSAYFISNDAHVAEIAASTYKSIMRGENSGVELGAINSWRHYEPQSVKLICEYVQNFMHPVFIYPAGEEKVQVTPCSLVSGNELAIHMGLPRKSVCGFPVIEHADFGKEVVNYNHNSSERYINLGNIFNMGSENKKNSVKLDVESLSMHTFITGSTGSGKSNTVYELLKQLALKDITFMVVEPAKGEYKHIFGNSGITWADVYGTNPEYSKLLKINPFAFPKGIHVLEHVDRLIEIFNVCWPMYAAMPAVLKEALLQAYEVCGWDLTTSVNTIHESLYPTFKDLLSELAEVIDNSAYDQEVKSNYKGSLETRVKSLTNGLNGRMFGPDEIDNKKLFDSNVIIDLSRIGSLETKSLVMGILVMRLSEHRMTQTDGMNKPLKHITVLEEAHNILKRTSMEQSSEGANVAGKSVEMISNAIAEMRTYGEGFIIADQSPSAVDISAIRNTNTKIIMRLPDEADRRLAGKAAALKDEQLDEIAKLPKGVAVVYQNDWIEPVLCKIKKYDGSEELYNYISEDRLIDGNGDKAFKHELLKLLLKGRVTEQIDVDIDVLENNLESADLSTKNKVGIYRLVSEYKKLNSLSVWNDSKFDTLSALMTELFDSKNSINHFVFEASDFTELNRSLYNYISTIDETISNEMRIALSQCFMKEFGKENESCLNIYAKWRETVIAKGDLI